MRPVIFIPIIILLYLAVPFCAYEAWYFAVNEAEQVKSESIIMNEGSSGNAQGQNEIDDSLKASIETIDAEKFGFYGATAIMFLIPTLMLLFRRRLLKG